jgi:putative ABC transport system substrate-binding protein
MDRSSTQTTAAEFGDVHTFWTSFFLEESLTNVNRKRVFDFAAARNLPTMYEYGFFVREGGLMSYGPDFDDLLRRAAVYVDKILRGTKPSDLPVELPTRYYLLVNLKTAKDLGLTVPPSLLLRADETVQ